MSLDNIVFRKIKEISSRGTTPRPTVTIMQLASELSVSSEQLKPSITELKQLRLLTLIEGNNGGVRLTLLGTVVERNK
jgi:DNA-binding IscR family transcriptional regulator